MSSNVKEFQLGVRDFAKKGVPQAMHDFRDAVALEGLRGVVMLTPVDTGRLRGNWQTTLTAPAEGELPEKYDQSGGGVISEGAATIGAAADPFTPIWLHNGLNYAVHVNNGTDKMAAVHMLEQTVERLLRVFKNWKGRR